MRRFIEMDHPLEIGESAAALNRDAGDALAFGDQRRCGRAQAVAEDDDARGIDPRMAGNRVERLAVMSDLGIVIEGAARDAFAVAGPRPVDANEHHSRLFGNLAHQARPVGGNVERAARDPLREHDRGEAAGRTARPGDDRTQPRALGRANEAIFGLHARQVDERLIILARKIADDPRPRGRNSGSNQQGRREQWFEHRHTSERNATAGARSGGIGEVTKGRNSTQASLGSACRP
jgi:hypothetical protein